MFNCIFYYSWSYLKSYMEKKIEKISYLGKKIPSSSGESGVALDNYQFQEFQKKHLDVLALNECQDVLNRKLSETEKIKNANEAIQHFFGGKASVDWLTFYYSFDCPGKLRNHLIPGIVERESVSDLVSNLQDIEARVIKDSREMVSLFGISHQPGSGATTVGKHALWKVKNKMRCAVVDGSVFTGNVNKMDALKRVAHYIISLRDYKENEDTVRCIGGSKPPTVVIMLDNSDPETAGTLQDQLLQYFKGKRIESERVQIIVMYLTSSNTPPKETRETLHISQNLYESEKDEFQYRLNTLEDQEIPLETVLTFVIMANNFDEKSEYVQKVVSRSLDGIDLYPKARKLLTYLSILKVFGLPYSKSVFCFGLPTKFCKRFIDRKNNTHPSSFLNMIPSQAQLFLTEKSSGQKSHHDSYIHVSHMPTAKQLLKNLCTDQELVENVKDLVDLLKDPTNNGAEVHQMIRVFLTRRNADESEEEDNWMESFSPLIIRLKNTSKSFSDSITILKKAFDLLSHEQQPFIAQVISKIFRFEGDFEAAEQWARTAITVAPLSSTKYFLYDNLGQVFKTQLR
jgi:hypothetical protein